MMHVPPWLTAMADAMEANGLTSRDELNALETRVSDHLAQPGTMTISVSMVQVVGTMPE